MRNPSRNTIKRLKKLYPIVWDHFASKAKKPSRFRDGVLKVKKVSVLDLAKSVIKEMNFRNTLGFHSIESLVKIEERWKLLEDSGLGEPFKLDN